ncbi:Class I SAM-dependent methyltransferase [Candidatus Hepatincolaceae symbiont of Richtersius coronifer]
MDYKKQHQKERLKIFEIGCGYGGNLHRFHQAGEEVYGCDYGAEGIDIARGNGLPHMYVGGISTLKTFGKADIIIINHILEHINDLKEFFRELKTLIDHNTLIYVGVPNIITGPYHFNLNVIGFLK